MAAVSFLQPPDNFWCAVFERAVKEYLKKSHNGKGIEVTFAHAEAIREHLKSTEESSPKNIGNYNASVGIAGSINSAKQLMQMIPQNGAIDERESEMMSVRWKVYRFNYQIPPQDQKSIVSCPKCFASLVLGI
ncbi:hypothetical protein QZH41_004850 [Actinostola sp. cb2023]|nr:hypothetical protein QZH41_004850 [Actinostola sp. cb2023]